MRRSLAWNPPNPTWLAWLLLPSAAVAQNCTLQGLCPQYLNMSAYWGEGWEEPVTRNRVYDALSVELDETSALIYPNLNDELFDFLSFEAGTGPFESLMHDPYTRVRGNEYFQAQPLQSWTPRHDAVQHGHFMLYELNAEVTGLGVGNTMEDFSFQITFDTHVHPDYEQGVALNFDSNSTVRFTLYESLFINASWDAATSSYLDWTRPLPDLTNPGTFLNMLNPNAKVSVTLSGGNDWDVETRRHRLTWGFGNNGAGGLNANCTERPLLRALYIGVQCLSGFAFPQGACTADMTIRPQLYDCRAYCPFTVEVRAIPRRLTSDVPVRTLVGPGQWQTFEVVVGEYDLLELTIDRADYDNTTYPESWQDGFSGRAWLSKGSCIRGATLVETEHVGYCPHGNSYANHMCTHERNWSIDVVFPPSQLAGGPNATYVLDVHVAPELGVLDDRGYQAQLADLAREYELLENSLHYPTQLQIRARIAAKQAVATMLNKANADWRRRWLMRMCTSPAEAGTYYLTIWGNPAMDLQAHSGTFLVRMHNQHFDRSPLADGIGRRGCLKRGGSESYVLMSLPRSERSSLALAEVTSYRVNAPTNFPTAFTLRRGAAPTATVFDAKVVYPEPMRIAMSACNVNEAQAWHLRVSLDPMVSTTEIYFTLTATLEDATHALGDSLSGFVCCNQYKYYAFTSVHERVAPSVAMNVTSGRLKAIYWRYDSCPVEPRHVVSGSCIGWCIVDWYRIFSSNIGTPRFKSSSTLTVPYGMGELPDKRRGGRWYLGIQALEGPATFTAITTYKEPPPIVGQNGLPLHPVSGGIYGASGCSRLDPYCPPEDPADRYRDLGTSSARRRLAGGSCFLLTTLLSIAFSLCLSCSRVGLRCRWRTRGRL